jgi:hypothetical protein
MHFAQYARTTRNYSLSLVDNTGGQIPRARPPVWSITSQQNLDGSPASHPLLDLKVSADGLRASVQTMDRAGVAVVTARSEFDGRHTVETAFTLNISAAPAITARAIKASIASAAPGPI